MSISIEAVPPAAAWSQAVGEWRGTRAPKVKCEGLTVDRVNRGVSTAGMAARNGLTAKWDARKWRCKGLKRLIPRPEMVWARKRLTHKV